MKKKTHDEYITELAIKNPNIIPQEKYIDAKTKILHKCTKHNISWKVTPDVILHGYGCKLCKKERLSKIKSKSHNEYVNELAIKNPNIKVIGEYIGADIPIKHYCKKHNIYWDVRPQNLLNGQGCLLCGREKTINASINVFK